jgi:membrane protein YdbS with pleckstrin-like domain
MDCYLDLYLNKIAVVILSYFLKVALACLTSSLTNYQHTRFYSKENQHIKILKGILINLTNLHRIDQVN